MLRPLHVCVGATLLVTVSGHGAVTHPKPRQAIDGRIAPWNGTVPDPIPFTNPQNWCAYPNAESKDPRGLSGGSYLRLLIFFFFLLLLNIHSGLQTMAKLASGSTTCEPSPPGRSSPLWLRADCCAVRSWFAGGACRAVTSGPHSATG